MAEKNTLKSQSPYFDDFDPSKDYVQVLFRPGYPVQARELTTLQSFLQEQVTRVGNYLFKEGNPVKAAEINYANDVFEMVLTADGNTIYPSSGAVSSSVLTAISGLENTIITNESGTVKARVLASPNSVDNSSFVSNIYIKYLTTERFNSDGGYIYATTTDNPNKTVTLYQTYSQTTPACVVSSSAGVFFAEGYLINSTAQSVVVSNTEHNPSTIIGFVLEESIITQNDDTTLYDNARGSTNEGAPGAHRLKWTLTLTSKSLTDPVSTNFYTAATYIDGVKQSALPEYSSLLELLARRTFDESGSYTVKPFNQTISEGDSDGSFTVNVTPGKAYVKGWEIDKASPTKIQLVRGLDDTKLSTNYKIPVIGTTSLEVNSVTGTLPGTTSGSPLDATSILQLKDGSNNIIGVARAWAVKDSYYKGVAKKKLYIYDVRMFTVITTTETSFSSSLQTGHDIVSNKTKGYVYTDQGAAGVTNGVAIISTTGKLRVGQTISSNTLGTQSTIASIKTNTTLQDVTTITSSGGFSATVVANSIENENSTLIVETDKHIKTLKNSQTNIMDNDYYVLEDIGGAVTLDSSNGNYDEQRIDDATEITKTLKFAYLKILTDSDNRSGSQYGWMGQDREVSLFYPDIHKVYKVSESTDGTFTNGAFDTLNISTPGIVPQGSVITGNTSGTKAIVALSNTPNTYETSLASNTSFHKTRTGTGSISKIQVVFTKGLSFTTGETLTVTVPSYESAYTYQVTVTSTTKEVGTDISGSFKLDNGQRAEYYDVGRLIRKNNVPEPSKDIIVFFSYFEANVTGHYYSADSYSAENFITVDPRYYGETKEIRAIPDNKGVDLRNTLDFRLRVDTNRNTNVSPFNFSARSFVDQDRIVPDTTFTTDFYEYLGRTDLISLQYNGNFKVVSGVPSDNPREPNVPQDGMDLFYVSIPPAVRYPSLEVAIRKVDNRRYTMRDIGEIDRKVKMLQEQVALSLLESQALHDDVDGRTKSGFVVDDFSLDKNNPQSSADPTHEEYKATIDTIERVLIPAQTAGIPVSMSVSSTLNMSTFFNNYLLRKFTEEAFNTQMNASTSQKINPFATWTFDGDLNITPNEDNWSIRTDNYFTSLYGDLKPFDGNSSQFDAFMRINTSSPGGRATTTREWIGTPSTSVNVSLPHTVPDPAWGGFLRQAITTTRTGAARTTTSIKFDEPRPTGELVETLTNKKVVENLSDYFMRPVTITYTAENLKPNTEHTLYFGKDVISTGHITDADGYVTGSFNIPAQTYKAGKENVELKDSKTSGIESFGVATFKSIGHHETYDVVATTVTETVKKSVGVATETSRRFQDPIAQMFTLPLIGDSVEESSILTSIDLWFSFVDTRASMNKVKIEIREAVNGYPGGPDKIIGESSYQTIDSGAAVDSITSSNGVNFKFKKPIVLTGGTEYAVVIKSPSDTMSVWVAEMGQQLIDGSGIHSSQPNVGGYYGSFFVSQNASTWNADQNKDLCYKLYRAKFDTSVDSTVTLVNTTSDAGYFKGDIGAYNQGLAMETFKNSDYVRVFHPNHGLNYSGAKVTISGVTTGTYNNIADSDLNKTHDVYLPTLDTYLIKTGVTATRSGKINTGIFTTFATQDVVYDSLSTNFMIRKGEADFVNTTLQTTTTSPINMSISNNKLANSAIATPTVDGNIGYEYDRVIEFEDPKIVRCQTNTTGNDLVVSMKFGSGTEYSSPILRTESNLDILLFRNLTGNFIVDSDLESLTVTDIVTDTFDSDGILYDSENGSIIDNDVLLQYGSYVQAIQNETEHSAYVTNQIDLEIPADGFDIIFDADMAPTAYINASYKIREPGDTTPFDELEWQDFPYAQQITEDNYGAFSSKTDYKQYKMRATTNFEFSSYKIRLRMGTENEAQIPKIRDLRIIADI